MRKLLKAVDIGIWEHLARWKARMYAGCWLANFWSRYEVCSKDSYLSRSDPLWWSENALSRLLAASEPCLGPLQGSQSGKGREL